MKLPHRDDPHGDKEMTLPRGHVLDVLYSLKISIEHHQDDSNLVDFTNDEGVYACVLPDPVGGILIKALSRSLGINSFEFYRNITKTH